MKRRSLIVWLAVLAVVAAACSSTGGGETSTTVATETTAVDSTTATSGAAGEPSPTQIEFLSIIAEDDSWMTVLGQVAELHIEEHPGSSFDVQFSDGESHDQQLQLLASSDSLPVMYHNFSDLASTRSAQERGVLMDLEPVLDELGITDLITPAARDTMKSTWGVVTLPFEMSITGFWYNKQMFGDLDLVPPTTWEELLEVADVLAENDIQPFAASGISGWPIADIIGFHIFANVGPDSLQAVADGNASLTDPEYVESARYVAEIGNRGYFGPGVSDLDYDAARDLFLAGGAGMYLMGSWVLPAFNDPAINLVGAENVGWFPLPLGDTGEQVSSLQIGWPVVVNEALYDEGFGEFLVTVAENFGTMALEEQGHISGFAVDEIPESVAPLTELIVSELESAGTPVTWFYQLFNARGQDESHANAALLVTGQMSPEDYMQAIQTALEE